MTSVLTSRRHGVNGSLAIKAPCKSASIANLTLSGEQTVDGVALVTGDRVLVKDQTTASENGIYAVNTSTWQREPDWDGARDVKKGTLVYVTDGSTTVGYWTVTTSDPITPGTTSVTIAAGFRLVNFPAESGETGITDYSYPPGDVRRYGAVGDGTTDDTAAIQAAINAGHGVKFDFGKTYLVSSAGTKTINSVANYYCLDIPTGTALDLNGATIKLDSAENATILINENAGTSQDSDIVIIGDGWLDPDYTNQTSPATGEMPAIRLDNVVRPVINGLKVKNARDYFGRFMQIDEGYFDNLHGETSYGDGWSFGIAANSNECTDTEIGSVFARNVQGSYAGLTGNPIIGVFIRCNIVQLYGDNCAGGIKIQDTSADTNVGSVIFIGGANTTANSGLKIQGGSGNPTRINVANVHSQDCDSEGLYIVTADNINIGSYTGENNGITTSQRDINIQTATHVSIGSINSTGCNGIGLLINVGADFYNIGRVNIKNNVGNAVQSSTTGSGRIESIIAEDDQGTPTMTYVLRVTGSGGGSCGSVRTNLAISTSQPRILIANNNYFYFIESFVANDGADPLAEVVTLANASSTAVTNTNIMRAFVGGTNYMHPVIEVIPWDAASAALSLKYRCTVTDYTSGTGFTIVHSAAAGTEKVFYKIVGYCVASAAGA